MAEESSMRKVNAMDEEPRKMIEDKLKESRQYRLIVISIIAMTAALIFATLLHNYLKNVDVEAERRLKETMEER